MNKPLYLVLLIPLCLNLYGQETKKFVFQRTAVVTLSDIKEDWAPVVQRIEAPKPDGQNDRLQQIKDSLMRLYPHRVLSANEAAKSPFVNAVQPPTLASNFQGNIASGSTPNDNDIAVSNGGKIVSVQNNSVFRYDITTSTALQTSSLDAFFQSLGNTQSKYDPKTIYDPVADRFIVLCLAGYTSTTSSILVAFSRTNDPSGAWNVYTIPGNPLNDNLWTDFPMIALTRQEAYITVNHLQNNQPWQTGFVRTVIWEIKKSNGYGGLALNALLHSAINYGTRAVRNLCPAKGDRQLYGPDIYFLSDRNLDARNDTVFLVRLTDTIGAPGQQVTVAALKSDIRYFAPPTAQQPGTTGGLQTNDARVLGAIFGHGQIQYVHNTLDTISGRAAIIHGVIDSVTTSPRVHAVKITDAVLEFGYPNLAWAGLDSTDKTTFISFLHTAATVSPGNSALCWDGTGYSSRVQIKAGLGYINILSGDDRWGDYSGAQPRYNTPGEVWVNGMYGLATHQNSTWIAELKRSGSSVAVTVLPKVKYLNSFPNPFVDRFEVLFSLEKPEILKFELYDMQGRLLKLLLNDRVKAGTNRFSFSGSALAKGIYLLRISSDARVVSTKDIIKN